MLRYVTIRAAIFRGLFAVSIAVSASAQPKYTVHDLGTLGGAQSSAAAINNAGQVVGESLTASGAQRAFRTEPDSAISASDDLGTLGGSFSNAVGINSSGQVIGLSETSTGQTRSFRTGPNQAIYPATDDLGTLGGSRGLDTIAHGIDDAGRTVGESAVAPSNALAPFRTAPNAPINPATDNLSSLVPNALNAMGINKLGDIIGDRYAFPNANYPSGYLLKNGVMMDLGPLGIGGVRAINDNEQIALNSDMHPYLWQDGTRIPIGADAGAAYGINNAGQVVGYFTASDQTKHGFLYSGGTRYDLNTLIPANSGFVITEANGINDSGQIAATAIVSGQTHAVRLDPLLTGSLAHIADGGGWTTEFVTVARQANSSQAAQATISLLADDGNPLSVPVTASGGSIGSVVNNIPVTLNSYAVSVTETAGVAQGPGATGWATVQSDSASVGGFAVFKFPVLNWSAAVPMKSENAAFFTLPFDNTAPVGTGVAVANVSPNATNVNVSIRDDSGAVIGSGTLPLPAMGHTSFMLNQLFPETNSVHGTVRFETPTASPINIIGLRANGKALTTLPVFTGVGGPGGLIAHTAFNDSFNSIFQLVNTGNTPAGFTLRFFDNNGNPQLVPLRIQQTGLVTTTSVLTETITPGGVLVIQTLGQFDRPLVEGSAQLATNGNIGAFEILLWTTFNSETSIPVELGNQRGLLLSFDETANLQAGIAISNGSTYAADVTLVLRDQQGTFLGSRVVSLPARGHTSFMLRSKFPFTAGLRGTLEVISPPQGSIGAIGIQANANGFLMTVPVMIE